MTQTIAIANQKGGVGKTTSCVDLAASLATFGKRVLLVDSDPQGNATMGCGIDKNAVDLTLNEILLQDIDPTRAIVRADLPRFDVIPGNSHLTQAEVQLLNLPQRELRLRHALAKIQASYDYILIDCPPSLNMLTIDALVAAQSVLVPMQCEYYSLEGLSDLLETLESIKKTANPTLHIEGILRTMYDGRNRLTLEVSEQLIQYFPNQVYRTVIPRNIRLAEAPSFGLPALLYDKKSQGAAAYIALAGEMIRRIEEGVVAQPDLEEFELENEDGR